MSKIMVIAKVDTTSEVNRHGKVVQVATFAPIIENIEGKILFGISGYEISRIPTTKLLVETLLDSGFLEFSLYQSF